MNSMTLNKVEKVSKTRTLETCFHDTPKSQYPKMSHTQLDFS